MWRWKPERKDLLFVAGLMGIAWEALRDSAERPTLLLLYAAMIGLPLVLRADDLKNGKHKENGEKPGA